VQQITSRARLSATATRKLLGQNALRLCPRLKNIGGGNAGRANGGRSNAEASNRRASDGGR
jgi:hypothetical protein